MTDHSIAPEEVLQALIVVLAQNNAPIADQLARAQVNYHLKTALTPEEWVDGKLLGLDRCIKIDPDGRIYAVGK